MYLQPIYSPANVHCKIILITEGIRDELLCSLSYRINLECVALIGHQRQLESNKLVLELQNLCDGTV